MIFNKKKKKLLQADKTLSFSFYNNIYIKFNSFDSNKRSTRVQKAKFIVKFFQK